jgi:hypothetical protein
VFAPDAAQIPKQAVADFVSDGGLAMFRTEDQVERDADE